MEQFSFISITQIVRLTRKFYAASMNEGDDLMEHITNMTALAQQLRELNEEISTQKFATVILGSLPNPFENFITSLNARNANQLTWELIKGPLLEEYMKKKERNELPNDALTASTRNWRQRNNNQISNHQFPRYNNNPQLQRYNHQNNSNMNRSHQQSQHRQFAGPTCYGCGGNGHIQRNCNNINRQNNYPHNTTNQSHQFNRNIREESNFACPQTIDSMQRMSIHNEFALIAQTQNDTMQQWFIDSGASKHMTSDVM